MPRELQFTKLPVRTLRHYSGQSANHSVRAETTVLVCIDDKMGEEPSVPPPLSGPGCCPCLQFFPKGIPSARRELNHSAVLFQQQFAISSDSSNCRETDPAKRIRQELCF